MTRKAIQQLRTSESTTHLKVVLAYIFPHGATAPSGPVPSHYWGFTITLKTHHIRYGSSGRVIGPSQRPLTAHNTHNRQTSLSAGGIRTRNPNKRAAADTHTLDRAEHWDRQFEVMWHEITRQHRFAGDYFSSKTRPQRKLKHLIQTLTLSISVHRGLLQPCLFPSF